MLTYAFLDNGVVRGYITSKFDRSGDPNLIPADSEESIKDVLGCGWNGSEYVPMPDSTDENGNSIIWSWSKDNNQWINETELNPPPQ